MFCLGEGRARGCSNLALTVSPKERLCEPESFFMTRIGERYEKNRVLQASSFGLDPSWFHVASSMGQPGTQLRGLRYCNSS